MSQEKQIIILGDACAHCKVMENRVREVVKEEQWEVPITVIGDIGQILKYGVLSTPALILGNDIVMVGHIGSKTEIKELIENYQMLTLRHHLAGQNQGS